jgi:hypothetical protein
LLAKLSLAAIALAAAGVPARRALAVDPASTLSTSDAEAHADAIDRARRKRRQRKVCHPL